MVKVEFKDQVASFWLVCAAPGAGCGEGACTMDTWAGAPVPGDLRFEDDGERLDRERFSDPGPGPFLTKSSWEQFKDEVGECESRAAVARVVPSARLYGGICVTSKRNRHCRRSQTTHTLRPW